MYVPTHVPRVLIRSANDSVRMTGGLRAATGLQTGSNHRLERAELTRWLRDAHMPSGTMDPVTLEGFLTALIVGPAPAATENWLPAVWGAQRHRSLPPRLRVDALYVRFRELVLQFHAEIARQFDDNPESFQPTFCTGRFQGIEVTIADPWCIGFVARMDRKPRAWLPLRKECPDLLHPILLYGTRAGWETRHRVRDSVAFHAEWWPQIAPAVHGIHRYWLARNAFSSDSTRAHGEAKRQRTIESTFEQGPAAS